MSVIQNFAKSGLGSPPPTPPPQPQGHNLNPSRALHSFNCPFSDHPRWKKTFVTPRLSYPD